MTPRARDRAGQVAAAAFPAPGFGSVNKSRPWRMFLRKGFPPYRVTARGAGSPVAFFVTSP